MNPTGEALFEMGQRMKDTSSEIPIARRVAQVREAIARLEAADDNYETAEFEDIASAQRELFAAQMAMAAQAQNVKKILEELCPQK